MKIYEIIEQLEGLRAEVIHMTAAAARPRIRTRPIRQGLTAPAARVETAVVAAALAPAAKWHWISSRKTMASWMMPI